MLIPSKEQRAVRIVERILDDLTDRRGLRQEWEQIEPDIQREIKTAWYDLVLGEL